MTEFTNNPHHHLWLSTYRRHDETETTPKNLAKRCLCSIPRWSFLITSGLSLNSWIIHRFTKTFLKQASESFFSSLNLFHFPPRRRFPFLQLSSLHWVLVFFSLFSINQSSHKFHKSPEFIIVKLSCKPIYKRQ